jgi:hypothetical protein
LPKPSPSTKKTVDQNLKEEESTTSKKSKGASKKPQGAPQKKKLKESASMETVEPKEEESTPKEEKKPAGKTKKILLHLSKDQRQVVKGWFGTARHIYNECVAETRTLKKESNLPENLMKHLREKFTTEKNLINTPFEWVIETPSSIRDGALQDFMNAEKTNNERENPGTIKFRSRKAISESIVIRNRSWKDGILFPTFFKKAVKKDSKEDSKKDQKEDPKENFGKFSGYEELPSSLIYDTRLQRTKLGQFYLCLLQPLQIRSEDQAPHQAPIGGGKLLVPDLVVDQTTPQ